MLRRHTSLLAKGSWRLQAGDGLEANEVLHLPAAMAIDLQVARVGSESGLALPAIYHEGGFMILCFVVSLAVFFLALRNWNQWRSSSTENLLQQPEAPRGQLIWLGWLATATFGLLVFQLLLGMASGSLTLLADLGHTAGDVMTYGLAYAAERAKLDFSQKANSERVVAIIDVTSALVNTVVVGGASVYAMVLAVARLRGGSSHLGVDGEVPDTDLRVLGPALLSFSFVSMATNIALLSFQQFGGNGVGSNGAPIPPSPRSLGDPSAPEMELVPPPPPPPTSGGDRPQRGRRQPRKSRSLSDALPPSSVSDSLPPSATSSSGTGRSDDATSVPQGPNTGQSRMRWLHAAFHPGCSGEGCGQACDASGAASSGASDGALPMSDSPSSPGSKASSSTSDMTQANLNVYGAVLHLATDVLRSIVVFAAGLLIVFGSLHDPERADSVCALVVGVCVLAGSAMLIRIAALVLRARAS